MKKLMKNVGMLALIGAVAFLLTGCASPSLKAPCPNFGKWCNKKPINSWNYK